MRGFPERWSRLGIIGQVEEPAEGTDQKQPEKRRFRVSAVGGSALMAAVSLASGLFGGWAGSALTVNASEKAEKRVQVGTVYAAYLDAANSYNNAALDYARAQDAQPANQVQPPSPAFEHARYEYQGAINDVYVYGSEDAWKANLRFTKVLPVALGNFPDRKIYAPNPTEFHMAYNQFLNVFCREAVAEPRKGCAGD